MFATLTRAETNYFPTAGLWGFIRLDVEGSSRLYAVPFPTAENMDPPGWSSVAKLSGVTADEVAKAWSDDKSTNVEAERAMEVVQSKYYGTKFIIESEISLGNTTAAVLVPLSVDSFIPKRMAIAEDVPAPILEVDYYTPWERIEVIPGRPGGHAFLRLIIPAIPEDTWPAWQVPDKLDHTPEPWWFIETFTNISHERVAQGWGLQGGRNAVLEDTVMLLSHCLQGHEVPILTDGTVDIRTFRRNVLRARRATQAKLPFLFQGRPTSDFAHLRELMKDMIGESLFVMDAEPGKSSGVPVVVAPIKNVRGIRRLVSEKETRALLVNVINFTKPGRPPKYGYPSDELIQHFLGYPDPALRTLRGLTRIPVLRPDGTILDKPGFDEMTGLWYEPDFELESIPEVITRSDIVAAVALIATPILEFPYVGENDRTGAICSLIEQIARPMIRGPRPLYLFDAPKGGQGSGKTLLAKIFQTILTGRAPFISALGTKEEEMEKRIVSWLRDCEPMLILDNLVDVVESQTLAALATSETFQARLLGGNKAPHMPQDTTWVLTLNAAKTDQDIGRRSVLVQLDAKIAHAWKRKGFKIEDPIQWAQDRRASIIRAVLILARAWVQAGQPKDPELVLGSFERWAAVVGGIAYFAGLKGLAKSTENMRSREVSAEDHKFLVRIWVNAKPDAALAAHELGAMAKDNGLYEPILGKKVKALAVGRAMSDVLKPLVGQIIEGHTFDVCDTKINGYTVYRITPTS